jgi:hypothetical protein
MKRTQILGSVAAAALAALLAVPLAHGVGTGGTGLRVYAHGALARIGGIVVKGITFDPSQAMITINGQPHSADDLQPGMVAGVDGNFVPGLSTGVARSIAVTRVALGAVTDIVPGAITQVGTGGTGLRIRVAGISVNPRPDVVIAGCASLGDITVGTTLDVYGYSDGILGVVDATRIECIGPSSEVELHGVASAITPTSIVVQGVTVDTSGAQFIGFAVPIAAGDRVEVDGTLTPQGIIAVSVTFEPDAESANGVDAEVEDAISAMMGAAIFVVDSFTIDATNAHFSNGTAADLAVGRVVHVEGTVVNGILNAKSVEFDDDGPEDGGGTGSPPGGGAETDDVDGAISAFASAASFVVHGVTIDASGAAFVNGAATDLANGKIVKVIGARTGTAMKATKVTFETGDTEMDDVDGAITAFTSVASFVVDGIAIDASAATFVNGTAADLAVGKAVKVFGTRTGAAMTATKVIFLSGSGGDDESDGEDGGGGSHHSGGGPGSGGGTNPGTSKPPSGDDGSDGHPRGSDGSSAEAEGRVGSLISPGVFTVGTVTVDARSARISGGSVADIREGVKVQVTGPIQAGTLVATRVEIDD